MIKVLIYLMIGVVIQLVGRIKMKINKSEDAAVKDCAELARLFDKDNPDDAVQASMALSEWSLFSIPGVIINTVLWPLNILMYLAACFISVFC